MQIKSIAIAIVILLFVPTVLGQDNLSDAQIYSVAWSPDGTKVAVGGGPEICHNSDLTLYDVKIINPTTNQILLTISGNTCSVNGLDWSPDGSKLLGVSLDELRVWNSTTGQVLLGNVSGQGFIQAGWKSDGLSIVTTDPGGNIRILSSTTGQTVVVSRDIYGTAIDWSPDGSKLVSGFYDSNNLSIISSSNGTLLQTLNGHLAAVWAVSWSPDGSKIASGSEDGIVKIWNATSGTQLLSVTAHTGDITSVSWNPNNSLLATTGVDGKLRIWDSLNGNLLSQISAVGFIYDAVWSPDGQKLAYGFEGGFDIVDLVGVSTLTPSTETTATPTVTLRSIFNPPSCAVACWLGIEPGVTTQKQVQEILAGLGIEYTVNPVSFPPVGTGEENGLYNFNVTSMPFINSQGFVAVHFADGIAGMIQIPVVIPSSMILQEYGSPYAAILEDKSSLSIVYPEYRMSFSTSIETIQSYFYYLEIGTERTVSNYFLSIDSFSAFVEDCETVPGSCLFATATPSG